MNEGFINDYINARDTTFLYIMDSLRAHGFIEMETIHFKETYTDRISPMRLVWGIRVALNLKRHRLDVKNLFSAMILRRRTIWRKCHTFKIQTIQASWVS